MSPGQKYMSTTTAMRMEIAAAGVLQAALPSRQVLVEGHLCCPLGFTKRIIPYSIMLHTNELTGLMAPDMTLA